MNDWISMIFPALSGILLGMIYFFGLWWTVGRLSRTDRPVGLYLLSFGLRITILLLAFFFLLNLGVTEFLVAFAGFLVTRLALVRRLGWANDHGWKLDSHSATSISTKTGTG